MGELSSIEDMLSARPAERGANGRLRLGEIVDGWRVEAFLGSGRSAEVYRVMSVRMGGEGALKLLVGEGYDLREHFEREVNVIRSLAISALPRFFGSGEVGGRPFYVMEYFQPLFLPLDRSEVVPFVSALARAVGDLHSAGYVHRDLKPGNVLRRRNGEPVLIDLGLVAPVQGGRTAGAFGGREATRFAVGTLDFAAPEQLVKGEASVRGDVFSLGKMLKACGGPRMSSRLRTVVRKSTSDDPSERYATAVEFAEAVERAGRTSKPLLFSLLAVACAVAVFLFVPFRGFLYRDRTPKHDAVRTAPAAPVSQPERPPQPESLLAQPGEDESSHFQRLLKIAERGDAEAQTMVAEAYFRGRGVSEDKVAAVKWYGLAAEAGVANAQASLGLCLLRGWGCEENAEAAVTWFSCAANEGHLGAMNDLAFCYMNGRGVERDETTGFAWAMKAAERGHAAAQTMVGECYLDGRGVKRNQERADTWLQRAARQGNSRAQMLLRTR